MSYILGINLSANDATPQFEAGSVGRTDDGKLYKYVQYNVGAGSVAAVAGNVAFYYAVSGTSAGQTTIVTSDVTDSGGIGAGVLQAALTDDYYGWVQIKGVATLTTALTAGSDGNALTAVGAGDGTLDVSAAVTDAVVAYAVDASAKIIMCNFPE
jgi:hypothetical protein